MSDRLTRQQVKTDEVHEVLDRIFLFIEIYWRQFVGGLAAIAVLAAIGVAWISRQEAREGVAQQALAKALRVGSGAIDPLSPSPEDEESPSFASEADRSAASRASLEAVIDEHGSSKAAQVARGLLAEARIAAGEREQAREAWEGLLAKNRGNALGAGAQLNLIDLARDEGRFEELAQDLEKELSASPPSLPADVLLFELGRTLEELGRAEDARVKYQLLVDEHARSPYVARARERLDRLG